jgi:hypothetical protein
MVLFSGVPCQIAGLKAFLQKEYDNLLTVDLVCHGVPSPAVWQKYLEEFVNKIIPPPPPAQRIYCPRPHNYIQKISFRDKTNGWKIFSLVLQFKRDVMRNSSIFTLVRLRSKQYGWKRSCGTVEMQVHNNKKIISVIESLNENAFMKGFLRDLYLRSSCYTCPSKALKSGSDITLGDYWGIQNLLPDFDDDKGVSLVMVNTEKGKRLYEMLKGVDDKETTYFDAFAGNPSIERSVALPGKRRVFFAQWQDENIIALINRLTADSPRQYIQNKTSALIVSLLRRMGLLDTIKSLIKKHE